MINKTKPSVLLLASEFEDGDLPGDYKKTQVLTWLIKSTISLGNKRADKKYGAGHKLVDKDAWVINWGIQKYSGHKLLNKKYT